MSPLSAAECLVATIQQMADRQTNAVLEVLGDEVNHLKQEQKYPQPPLTFQQGPWRAFYHCHPIPDSDLPEHGHFHLFTQYQQQWVHVAALSMDAEGQPQAWVMVNRWVTDGPWLPAAQLQQHLATLEHSSAGMSLLETWLLAMVQVFADEIAALLESRDRFLREINTNIAESVLLDKREIYTLATHKFDLLAKLKKFYPELQAGGSQ